MSDRGMFAGLFDNLPLKGFALVLALALWTVVPDPSVLYLVPGVPVQLDNVPPELALAEAVNVTLDVNLRGSALRTRTLSPGELAPRLDMFGMFEGDNTVVITPDMIPVPHGVTVASVDPPQITVAFERRVRREVPVSVIVEGSPGDGYQFYGQVVDPPTVLVSGPASHMAQLDAIATEKIGVSGLQESLTRSVRVLAEDPRLTIEGRSEVSVTVEVGEQPTNFQLQGVEVTIINDTYRTVVNPTVIGVVLRGPPSVLNQLTPENFTATIDVTGLDPQAEDYRLEPVITLAPLGLESRVEVVAITPQTRLDVHVFQDSR